MRVQVSGWKEAQAVSAQMIGAITHYVLRPPGCTCPSNSIKTPLIGHALLGEHVEYRNYMKLRAEYLSGRKRTNEDGKILRGINYSPEELTEIERTKRAVEAAAEKLRVLGETWRSFGDADNLNTGVSLEIARYVQKIRYERNMARRELRQAERAYRMANEVPVLREWFWQNKKEPAAHSSKFLPWEPGMKVKIFGRQPVTVLDTSLRSDLRRK